MKRTVLTLLTLILIFSPVRIAAADTGTDTAALLSAYIGGCDAARDIASMTAVGAVIMNRCAADRYPDTITANGASLGILPTPAPSPIAVYSARLVLSGLDPTSGALSFFPESEAPAHTDEYITFSSSGLCFVK